MIWMGGQIQGHKVREIFRNQRRGQKLEKPGCPRENTHGTPGGIIRNAFPFLFDSLLCHLQHTGTVAGFGLIAVDGKIFSDLRAVIV